MHSITAGSENSGGLTLSSCSSSCCSITSCDSKRMRINPRSCSTMRKCQLAMPAKCWPSAAEPGFATSLPFQSDPVICSACKPQSRIKLRQRMVWIGKAVAIAALGLVMGQPLELPSDAWKVSPANWKAAPAAPLVIGWESRVICGSQNQVRDSAKWLCLTRLGHRVQQPQCFLVCILEKRSTCLRVHSRSFLKLLCLFLKPKKHLIIPLTV